MKRMIALANQLGTDGCTETVTIISPRLFELLHQETEGLRQYGIMQTRGQEAFTIYSIGPDIEVRKKAPLQNLK